MLSALSWTKGYSWLARRLKTGPPRSRHRFPRPDGNARDKTAPAPKNRYRHGLRLCGKDPAAHRAHNNHRLRERRGLPRPVIGLSPVNDIDGAPDRTMKCRVALPVPDEVKRWKTMGFGTCQRQIVQPWSKLAQAGVRSWKCCASCNSARGVRRYPSRDPPTSISFMQLPHLHSVSLQQAAGPHILHEYQHD